MDCWGVMRVINLDAARLKSKLFIEGGFMSADDDWLPSGCSKSGKKSTHQLPCEDGSAQKHE
jgi:hypothetical protein